MALDGGGKFYYLYRVSRVFPGGVAVDRGYGRLKKGLLGVNYDMAVLVGAFDPRVSIITFDTAGESFRES